MKQQNKKIKLRIIDSTTKSEESVEELVEVEASSPDTTESFAGVCADLSFEEKNKIVQSRHVNDQFRRTLNWLSVEYGYETAMKMCESVFGQIRTNI